MSGGQAGGSEARRLQGCGVGLWLCIPAGGCQAVLAELECQPCNELCAAASWGDAQVGETADQCRKENLTPLLSWSVSELPKMGRKKKKKELWYSMAGSVGVRLPAALWATMTSSGCCARPGCRALGPGERGCCPAAPRTRPGRGSPALHPPQCHRAEV